MESQNIKIALYKKRSFGDKLSATFQLIKIARKPMFKYMIYWLLPICIVQVICTIRLMDVNGDFDPNDFANNMQMLFTFINQYGWAYLFLFLASLASSVVLISLMYTLIKYYSEDQDSSSVSWDKIKEVMKRNVRRSVALLLISVLIAFVYILVFAFLAAASPYSLIFPLVILFILWVPLNLLPAIYLFEDTSLLKAFGKTFRIGFPTWGGTFMLLLINGILGGIVSLVFGLPYFVVSSLRVLFMDGRSAEGMSFAFILTLFILGLIFTLGSCLGQCFIYISMGYQYGHAATVGSRQVVLESEDVDSVE